MKHTHNYGQGWIRINQDIRTHIQICLECHHRLETPVTNEPKLTGPRLQGLSSGERFSR